MDLASRAEAIKSGNRFYFTGKPCPNGHMSKRYVSTHGCVECLSLSQPIWNAANIDKVRQAGRESARRRRALNPDAVKRKSDEYRASNPERAMYWAAKARAKRFQIPFSITLTDVVIPEFCPVLGMRLMANTSGGMPAANSPSLDKIIPSLGYVPGNIRVISYKANTMKQDASPEQLMAFALSVLADAGVDVPIPRSGK